MEYKLKISADGATWGIVIIINAETSFKNIDDVYTIKGVKINKNVFLQSHKVGLIDDELNYLIQGIIKVYDKFSHLIKVDNVLVIKIYDIIFDELDYQKEGLFCAIIGWLAQEFNFEQPVIPIQYNRSENKYFIEFNF